MIECYECQQRAVELSARSLCVHCEFLRSVVYENENEDLRANSARVLHEAIDHVRGLLDSKTVEDPLAKAIFIHKTDVVLAFENYANNLKRRYRP